MELDIEQLDFEKGQGLIPAIIQDVNTLNVLMLGYMNREALEKTLTEQRVTFFSRSKNRLWTKGETSGNFLELHDIQMDCDQDALLVKVTPKGPVCHTGAATCFETTNESIHFLSQLEATIQYRKQNPKEGSYTNKLFRKGVNKIAQKVGEEAVELVIEAIDDNKKLLLEESADFMYHFLVLLAEKGCSLKDVAAILAKRHQPKPTKAAE